MSKNKEIVINIQDIVFNDIKNKYRKIEITNKNYNLNSITKIKYVNINTNEILYAELFQTSLTTYEIGVNIGLLLKSDYFRFNENAYTRLNNYLKQTYQRNEKLFLYNIKLL